jgi:hypothetical protein
VCSKPADKVMQAQKPRKDSSIRPLKEPRIPGRRAYDSRHIWEACVLPFPYHCHIIHSAYLICSRGPARLKIREFFIRPVSSTPYETKIEIKTKCWPTLSCVCATGTIQTGVKLLIVEKGKEQPTTRAQRFVANKTPDGYHQTIGGSRRGCTRACRTTIRSVWRKGDALDVFHPCRDMPFAKL